MRALRVTVVLAVAALALPAAALATQGRAARTSLSITTFVERIFSPDHGYDVDGDGVLRARDGEFARLDGEGHAWDVTRLAGKASGNWDTLMVRRRQVRHWLRHWDRSHDGRLSRKEFARACTTVYGDGSVGWREHCRHTRYTSFEDRIF
jgi:hypothetical protein